MDKNGTLEKWKQDFLRTHKMVTEYLEREGMDPEGLGEPFNWIIDILGTAAHKLKIEEARTISFKSKIEKNRIAQKAEQELKRGEFAGYPYYEGEEWGAGPEPEEPNPYHGTYSEE